MKMKNSSEQIQANLDLLINSSSEVISKGESWNLIVVQTPQGKMKIRSKLTGPEWLLKQQMRLTNLPSKKKKRK